MKKYVFFLFLILAKSISAQIEVDYILKENFKDNRNSWKLTNKKDFKAEIKNNILHINNKTKHFKSVAIKTKLNLKKDFKIETNIKLISGTNNNELSIIFNKDEKNHNYNTYEEFGFSDNGSWRYDKKIDYNKVENTGWMRIAHIKSKEFNKLTIIKIDENIFYLINDKPVLVKNSMDFYYKNMAIRVCNNVEIAVKNLNFGYLKSGSLEKQNLSKKLYQEVLASKNENVLIDNTVTKDLQTSFKDNKMFDFFLGETENYSYKINNNSLELENKSKNFYQTWSSVKINQYQNFDLSASIKRVDGTKNKGISLIIKDKKHTLQFAFASSGHWFTDLKNKNKSYNFTKWQKTTLIKETENNSLRIKKIGGSIYFILNDKVLNKLENISLGNEIYIKIPDSIKVQVNNLKLTQTFNSNKEQKKLIAKYDKLWDEAKLENIGAFGKTEEQQLAFDKGEKKFRKKQDKVQKKYNSMFKGAPISEVIKKLGRPYKSNSVSMSYKYNDAFNGRPQDIYVAYLEYRKGNLKYKRVEYIAIGYR